MTKEVLEQALEDERVLSKAYRLTIKEPTRLCDECMNEWTNFTLAEEKLCDKCYEEKYGKTKVG